MATLGAGKMEQAQQENVPRWVWRLISRLGQLERGKVYELQVIMVDGEPIWTVGPGERLENWRAQPVLK